VIDVWCRRLCSDVEKWKFPLFDIGVVGHPRPGKGDVRKTSKCQKVEIFIFQSTNTGAHSLTTQNTIDVGETRDSMVMTYRDVVKAPVAMKPKTNVVVPLGTPGSGKSYVIERAASGLLGRKISVLEVASDKMPGETPKQRREAFKEAMEQAVNKEPDVVFREKNGLKKAGVVTLKEINELLGGSGRVTAVLSGTPPAYATRVHEALRLSGGGGVPETREIAPLTPWEIAVLLSRVLARGRHVGGLDSDLDIAMRLMMGFIKGFVGDTTRREELIQQTIMVYGRERVLFMPICSNVQFELEPPYDLMELVMEGLAADEPVKELSEEWEERVREEVWKLDTRRVELTEESSRRLIEVATDDIARLWRSGPSSVTSYFTNYEAAVNLEDLEKSLASQIGDLGDFVQSLGILQRKGDEVHVTLRRMDDVKVESDVEMLEDIHARIGEKMGIIILGIVWEAQKAVALKVMLDSDDLCANTYPHITLGTKGVGAVYSNMMLEKNSQGVEAVHSLSFEPVRVEATVRGVNYVPFPRRTRGRGKRVK
jgi:hypothetical protein